MDGEIEITLANEERPPDILPVVGAAVSRVDYGPEQLFLPRRIADEYVHQGEIFLASRDGKPLQVTAEALPPSYRRL